MTIFIEPSTDQFLLAPGSIIKILALKRLQDVDADFQFDYHSDAMVIWMATGYSAQILIDGKKVFSLYEEFDW
ncbi:hypothetical protein [Psychrobacter glacincola]|uniref:hypothetical protein n=1 Tax=Psychrobacter glacincola TaxID=56810 RepID=UPI003BB4A88B